MTAQGLLECVINVSEGAHLDRVELIGRAAGAELLDVHTDADHNRSVLTVVGESAAQAITATTILTLDLRDHEGAHPRIGAVDVVPFVPLGDASMSDARAARDRFAAWAATELGVPCFLYGPERTLPEIRRNAFTALAPDVGPTIPHPTAGAIAVGVRPLLVAYNLWLVDRDPTVARTIARDLRGADVRALGLQVGSSVQVSCNLINPMATGPQQVYDAVASRAHIDRAELVGLVPRGVLERTADGRWSQLDLDVDRTIEARLVGAGLVDATWRATVS